LTQKLVFSEIAMIALKVISREGSVHDVVLMQQLGFTPPSWKIWKPKLIEIFSINTFSKLDSKTGKIKIEYSKKEKLWRAIDIE